MKELEIKTRIILKYKVTLIDTFEFVSPQKIKIFCKSDSKRTKYLCKRHLSLMLGNMLQQVSGVLFLRKEILCFPKHFKFYAENM